MGDTAVGLGEITAGRGDVQGGHAGPDHAHGDLGVEVEAAGGAGLRERAAERFGGIDAEAEEGVADERVAEGFEVDEADAKCASVQAFERDFGAEDGQTEDEGGGLALRGGHEGADMGDGVLAVGVHHEDMGEAGGERGFDAGEDGGAFAAVARAADDAEMRFAGAEGIEGAVAAVGAAVDHDPHGLPMAQGFLDGGQEAGAGIVARDEHEVG